MRPSPLRTRTDLLRLLRPYAISAACGRAMDEDRVTVLGSFAVPGGFPRYMVRVISKSRREWLLALVVDDVDYQYRVAQNLIKIPWSQWQGDPDRRHPLLDGDEPEVYAGKRDNGETDWTSAYRAARSSQELPD